MKYILIIILANGGVSQQAYESQELCANAQSLVVQAADPLLKLTTICAPGSGVLQSE